MDRYRAERFMIRIPAEIAIIKPPRQVAPLTLIFSQKLVGIS